MGGIFIASVVPNPKIYHESDDEEIEEFTQDELENLDLSNIPLSLSHKDDVFKQVGRIENQFIFGSGQRDLMATGVFGIEMESYYGIIGLLENQYRDVSLQHLMTKYVFSSDSYMLTKEPIEVSLCREGRRYGSSVYLLISDFSNNGEREEKTKNIYASLSNIKKFHKRGKK